MDRVFLAHEDGDAGPLRDALASELGGEFSVEVVLRAGPHPDPREPSDRRLVLPLYPQHSERSGSLASLVQRAHHLVWFSYLDAYVEAVAASMRELAGSVVLCAEDLASPISTYTREVRESAAKIAARAGRDYELRYLGANPQDVLAGVSLPIVLVPLTCPIECAATALMDELAVGCGVRAPVWGCHPALVRSFASLIRNCLSGDD